MRFSPKQRQVLTWWMPDSPHAGREAIFCDGAVRSGKTLAMGLGFFLWAMCSFRGQMFGLCGKTIGSVRRNMVATVVPLITSLGMQVREKRSENLLLVQWRGRENRFCLFGGQHEGSAGLIQGVTFAGVLLDEAALMPRSFVEQACARCSVPGSRIWFNCNPEGPTHWLYTQWVQQAQAKNCLRLHFTMADNPSLSQQVRQRYERLYDGVFYQRYVLGLWVQAQGRVYDFFTADMAAAVPQRCDRWYISCDYGTVNPTSMGLWGRREGVWYRVKEFYFDSRREGRQMTDGEYAQALAELAGDRPIQAVIVDPSAASFLEVLRRQGWRVKKARNDVLGGIRRTSELLKKGDIRICTTCGDCLREMEEYVWDLSSGSRDQVCKAHDHAMDDMRYFVSTVLAGPAEGPVALTVARRT